MFILVAALLCSFCALSLSATDVNLSDDVNVAGRVVELNAGDRLVIPAIVSSTPFEVKARIKVQGAATLEVPEGADSVLFTGGLWAPGEGALAISGGNLLFGAKKGLLDIDYPRFDCPVSFDEGYGLVLTNAATLHRLPDASVPVAIAKDAILALRGTNTLTRFMNVSGATPSFTATSNYTVQVHCDSAFPEGTTVTVKPGATFALKLCTDKEDAQPEDRPWQWSGVSGVLRNIASIALESEGSVRSRYLTLCRKNCQVYSEISGDGDFELNAIPVAYEDRHYYYGACSFKGTVTMRGANAALYFHQESPGDHDNAVVMVDYGRMSFQAASGGTTPSHVYIRSLTSAPGGTQIWIPRSQTLEIGESHGSWSASGDGPANVSVLQIDKLVDGVVRASPTVGLKLLAYEAGMVGTQSFNCNYDATLDLSAYTGPWPLPVDVSANMRLSVTAAVGATGSLAITGPGTLAAVPAGFTVVPQTDGFAVIVPQDGAMTVDVSSLATNWQNKVGLWFDASETETLHAYPDNTCYTNNFPLIMSWGDKRKNLSGRYLHNGRSFASTSTDFNDRHDEVYPYVVRGGLNGRDYVSMGAYQEAVNNKYQKPTADGNGTITEARRLTMQTGVQNGSRDATTNYAAAYAIMVFGSQQGGGAAVLGASGALARDTAVTAPFTKTANPQMVVDGVATRGQASHPNGGWQILSLEMGSVKMNALGWNNAYNNAGGQNYAEVILFETMPTELERLACEAYLAEKWGLTDSYRATRTPAPVVDVNGSGTLTLVSDTVLAGGFTGTVTVPADTTLVVPGKHVADVSCVPSANRLAWFDPDFAGSLVRRDTSARPLCVSALYARTEDGLADTGVLSGLEGDADRRPWANLSARGDGPQRVWLDFSNIYSGDMSGNTLRHKNTYENSTASTPVGGGGVREGFLVLDTSRGGGSPIGTNVNMDNARRANRGTNIVDAIWAGYTKDPYKNFVTRLDNVLADNWGGFSGHPEVLEFTSATDWAPAFFGSYQDGEGADKNADTLPFKGNAEIMGEMLFYSEPLSDVKRAEVTAYLAYKWFGKVMKGYTDLSRMTVAGAGRVEVADLADLPKFADGFSGTAVCTARAYSFTLDPSTSRTTATDAVDVTAALELPKGAAITVTSTTDLRPGVYKLIGGMLVLPGDALPELVFTGANPTGYKVKLVKTSDGLFLVVGSLGTQVIVR